MGWESGATSCLKECDSQSKYSLTGDGLGEWSSKLPEWTGCDCHSKYNLTVGWVGEWSDKLHEGMRLSK